MAVEIGRTGEYGHNNSARAFVDSNFVRGGGREVTDLSALYSLAAKSDQLKENVTIVWVVSESAFYVLTDDTNISSASGWTELSSIVGGSGSFTEQNDLTASVIWANVPDANITETSVTQHQAALTIGQNQVSNLTTDLSNLTTALALEVGTRSLETTNLQNQITANDVDIAANASNISTNAQNITALQNAVNSNDTDIQQLQTDLAALNTDDIPEAATNPTNVYYTEARFNNSFANKSTDNLTQGSTNLYNVKSDWNASSGATSEILNKPLTFPPSSHTHNISDVNLLQSALDGKVDDSQVLTNVPANAVFTDTNTNLGNSNLTADNNRTYDVDGNSFLIDINGGDFSITDSASSDSYLQAGTNVLQLGDGGMIVRSRGVFQAIGGNEQDEANLPSDGVFGAGADITYLGASATTIFAGRVYYYDGTTWVPFTNTTEAPQKSLLGIAIGTTMSKGFVLKGFVNPDSSSLTSGQQVFVAGNATVTNTVPSINNFKRVLGHAVSTSVIYFNPSHEYIKVT